MERLEQFVEVLDQYDALIGGAPQEIRSDLRRLYQLPADADMIREDVDHMGTYEVEDRLQDIYDSWLNDDRAHVPVYYARLLDDPEHMDDIVDRIDDIMNQMLVRIDIHQRALRPTSRANTFINTRDPGFAFDQENMPP
jgi:predicted ATP-dependent Lon-type protease